LRSWRRRWTPLALSCPNFYIYDVLIGPIPGEDGERIPGPHEEDGREGHDQFVLYATVLCLPRSRDIVAVHPDLYVVVDRDADLCTFGSASREIEGPS
jgi:hypothetical protein